MINTFIDLIKFIIIRKKYWLLPIVTIMLIFGIFLLLTEGSALAPFVYTLF